MPNNPEPSLIQWITAIGAVATPILLAVFSAIGWAIKKKVEENQKKEAALRDRARKLEEELREDRLKVYNEILEPFMLVFTKDEGVAADKKYKGKTKEQIIQSKILSTSYRQTAFRLSLFAADEVVRAYNGLMQFFYSQGDNGKPASEETVKKMMFLFGNFLLAIRKSVGNEDTQIDSLEMLEWLISDISKFRDNSN